MRDNPRNILIDLMGLSLNDLAFTHKLRVLKERTSLLTGRVEEIAKLPEDIELRSILIEMVEDFVENL